VGKLNGDLTGVVMGDMTVNLTTIVTGNLMVIFPVSVIDNKVIKTLLVISGDMIQQFPNVF
jgi:hypothetical protein